MKSVFKIGGVIVILLALLVAVGATISSAQTLANDSSNLSLAVLPVAQGEEPTPDETDDTSPPFGFGERGHRGPGPNGVAQEAIAGALGMTVDELTTALESQSLYEIAQDKGVTVADLQAAIEEARRAEIEAAVADGSITQAQADILLEQLGNGMGQGLCGGEGGMMGGLIAIDQTEMDTAIANALGISLEEFQAARLEGKHLDELIVELGADEAAVTEAMQAVRDAAIQQALDEGLITEAQAEQLRSFTPGLGHGGMMGEGGMGRGGHGGPGRGGHPGGMMGGFGGFGQNQGQGQATPPNQPNGTAG